MALNTLSPVSDVYNVKEMGCACDAVQANGVWTGTDDRAVLQRIIDIVQAAGGGTLYFPGFCLVGRSGSNSWCLTLNSYSNITFTADRGFGGIVAAAGMPNASVAVVRLSECNNIVFQDFTIDGNWGNAVTTVAVASADVALPTGTINVLSTARFPASGTFTLITQTGVGVITYTGKTATSFTGCTGGAGLTLEYNQRIGFVNANTGINHTSQADPKNYGLMVRGCRQIYVENSVFMNTYGDGMWVGSSGNDTVIGCEGVFVNDTTIDVTARNGISFAGNLNEIGARLINVNITNIYTGAVDTEDGACRDLVIEGCFLDAWFDPGRASTGNIPLSIVGGSTTAPSSSTNATKYRVSDCTINNGGILIQAAQDVAIERCRVLVDFASSNPQTVAPICVTNQCDAIKLLDNYIYDRVPGNSGGNHDGSITVHGGAPSTHGRNQPAGVLIQGNTIDARNGIYGMHIAGIGGNSVDGVYTRPAPGTATATTDSTMTDGAAAWTVDQWIGWVVRIGAVQGSVISNTATVLTLQTSTGIYLTKAWFYPNGEHAPKPAAGTYQLFKPDGATVVTDNTVDCSDDGYGGGGVGIYFANQVASTSFGGMRVWCHGNSLKNCEDDGIEIEFLSTTRWETISIYDNTGFDDQSTPTMTSLVKFTGTPRYDQLIMYNNQPDASVTNAVSGLTTGVWMTRGGSAPMWAGFGSPETVVTAPIGAMYQRLDGTTASVLYVKESGTGNTGWIAYASPVSAPPKVVWFNTPVGGTTTLQTYGPTLTINGTPTNPGYTAGAYYTSFPHIHVASAAGAGSQCGYRANGFQNFLRGTTAGGGFRVVMRFGVADAALVATANMFVGLSSSLNLLTDVAPSTLTNIIGVGCDNGDTVLQLYCADGSARARVSLGANFPVNTTNTDLYELELYCAPSGTTVNYTVRRLNTGHVTSGVLSANLPTGSTTLTHHFQRSNGGTASAVTIDFFSFYSELEA